MQLIHISQYTNMKNTIILSTLFFALSLGAQTTEYKVDAYYVSHTTDTLDIVEPIDSIQFDTTFTYTLSVFEISANEKDTVIRKKGGLTSVSLQAQLYNLTRQVFNQYARLQWSASEKLRERITYLAALTSVGLNDYYASERTRVRQQLNGTWIVRAAGVTYTCEVKNNTGALYTTSSDTSGQPINTLIARIIPRSRLLLSINFEPGFGEDMEVFSSGGTNYIGQASDNSYYRLIFR